MANIPLNTLTEGNVANIQKAALILDGTVITYGEMVDLMALLGSITETDGWTTAAERSWGTVINRYIPGFTDEDRITAEHPGGGAELILNAFASISADIWYGIAIQTIDGFIMGGNVTITNTRFEAGLELRVVISGDMLIVVAQERQPVFHIVHVHLSLILLCLKAGAGSVTAPAHILHPVDFISFMF